MFRSAAFFIIITVISSAAGDAGKAVSGRCDNGRGTFLYTDLSMYTGEWKNKQRHGEGIMYYPDGSELRGEFCEDRPHGFAVFLLPDGRVRRIRFNKGRTLTSSYVSDFLYDGAVYGEYSSQGRYRGWYRGTSMTGYKPHGRGIMKWVDGSEYSGEWREGKIHGRGTMVWENGSRYSGQWEDGRRTGYGIFSSPEGAVSKGRWRDNALMESLF
jgi:1-phosphatidylinositol-4-phosphate 5-kinase